MSDCQLCASKPPPAIQNDSAADAAKRKSHRRRIRAAGNGLHNAGILGQMCPMSEETLEGYEAVQAVNLRDDWRRLG